MTKAAIQLKPMKNDSNEEKAKALCNYFRDQIEIIDNLYSKFRPETDFGADKEPQLYLHKQSLLVTMLDAMSNIIFHETTHPQLNKKNQRRFVRFISQFAEWPQGNLVSLPFLADALRDSKIKTPLSARIQQKVDGSPKPTTGNLTLPEIDEAIEDLLNEASTEIEEDFIIRFQHYAILYRYRNALIHEARRPGYAMEFMSQDGVTPCYHCYENDQRFFLLYPVGHFRKLVSKSAENMEKHLIKGKIDVDTRISSVFRF